MKSWLVRTFYLFILCLIISFYGSSHLAVVQGQDLVSKNYFYFETGEFGVKDPKELVSSQLPTGWNLVPVKGGSSVSWLRNNPLTRLHASPNGDKFNKVIEFHVQADSPIALQSDVFAVEAGGAYQITGFMKTQGNFVSETVIDIDLLDKDGKLVKRVSSSVGDYSLNWKKMTSAYFIVPSQCDRAHLTLRTRTKGSPGLVWVDEMFVRNYNLGFEVDNDNDNFPDNWVQYYNEPDGYRDFPGGNRIYLVKDDTQNESGSALRLDLQEGHVAAQTSGFLPVDPFGSYEFSGFLKSSDDPKIEAMFELLLYDEDYNLLPNASIQFDAIHGTIYWGKPYLQYIERFPSEDAHYARIRVNLLGNGAIHGSAWFDQILLTPLPRIVVKPIHALLDAETLEYDPERLFVFTDKETVAFDIEAQSLPEDNYRHQVIVTNAWGEELMNVSSPAKYVSRKEGRHFKLETTFNLKEPGYLFMEILLFRNDIKVAGKHVSFGIVRDSLAPVGGTSRTGLTLDPYREDYLALLPLVQILNVGRVKLPVWYPELELQSFSQENERRLSFLSKRIRQAGMHPIGVFGNEWQPVELFNQFSTVDLADQVGMYSVYRGKKEFWEPYIIKQIKSLGSQIDDWQMMSDADPSFEGKPNVSDLASAFRQVVKKTASWAAAGMSVKPSVTNKDIPTDMGFVNWKLSPDKTWLQIRDMIAAHKNLKAKWVAWYQVSVGDNRRDQQLGRVEQLGKQLIELLSHEDVRVFYDVFRDEARGLIRENLQPKPEYFVMRTVSNLLGAAQPQPSLNLENQSIINRVFTRGEDDMILVIWTDGPDLTEKIYLGENLQRIDMMGVHTMVGRKDRAYDMKVTSMPVIYTGIDRDMLMSRLSFNIDNPILESTSDPQPRHFMLTNHFDSPLSGTVELRFPKRWNVSQRRLTIPSLAPGKSISLKDWNVDVTVGVTAPTGEVYVELVYDFVVQAKGIRHSNIHDRRKLTLESPLVIKSTVAKKTGQSGSDFLDVSLEFVNQGTTPITARVEFQLVGANARREWVREVYNLDTSKSAILQSIKLSSEFAGNSLNVYVRETGGGGRFMNTSIPLTISE